MIAVILPIGAFGKEAESATTGDSLKNFFDSSYGIDWNILKADAPKRITPALMEELITLHRDFPTAYHQNTEIKYQVFTSDIPGVFSLGGDLGYFAKCVRNNDVAGLKKYGHNSIELILSRSTNFNLPVTTISTVKGAALGGGFEAALASNYLIAERQSTFSFPETRFGIFPGMGAFTFLRQRIPVRQAEEIIYSGKTYSAEDLYRMGVVDRLAEEGEGDAETIKFVRERHQQHQGIHAMREMVQRFTPVDRDELYVIVDHWIDSVLKLNEKQIRLIEALSSTTDNYLSAAEISG